MTEEQPRSPLRVIRSRRTPVVVTGIVAVLAVVVFGLLVARTSGMTSLDQGLSSELNRLHTGLPGAVTSAIYAVFSPAGAIAITALVAAILWIASRSLWFAITFAVVVGVTWVPSAIVKAIVDRPRPDVTQLAHPLASHPIDASYPSGHMAFVTALVVTLVLLSRGRSFRPIVIVIGALLVALVALSLVIDGVHYPSDVIASVVWSGGVAPLVLFLWTRLVLSRAYRRRDSLERTPA